MTRHRYTESEETDLIHGKQDADWEAQDAAELTAYREAVNAALATRRYFGEPMDDFEQDTCDELHDEALTPEQAAAYFENTRQSDAERAYERTLQQ